MGCREGDEGKEIMKERNAPSLATINTLKLKSIPNEWEEQY